MTTMTMMMSIGSTTSRTTAISSASVSIGGTTFAALLPRPSTTSCCCCCLHRETKPSSIIYTSKHSKSFTAASSQDSHHPFLLRVTNDGGRGGELSSSSSSSSGPDEEYLKREADRMVDGLNFGELCNEFECISSPLVESTARQLVRDILELREGNRALGTFALSVQYKDPVRSFSGRDKYKRPLWITTALEKPSVSVQEMSMLSTSVLSIKWTIKGKPRNIVGSVIVGDLIVKVNSQFTLNQISGQVIQHQEFWDLSASSFIAQAYFWTSRRLFATVEAGKDLADAAKTISSSFPTEKQNMDIYSDPTDPTKFFQKDDGFQRDVYQIGLFLALVYFVVQLLKTTL